MSGLFKNPIFDWFSGNSAAREAAATSAKFNANQVAQQQNFNSAEAQKNRDFQREMSNSAVSRRAIDLKKNGFNPIMAIQGSGAAAASSPSGSTASSSAAQVGIARTKGAAEVIGSLTGLVTAAGKLGK